MRYRRRFEITADVLRAAGEGSRKTKIMYFANLSYLLLKKYLNEAVLVGFLRFNGERYEVTDRGRVFLDLFSEFSSKSSRVKQDIESLEFEEEMLNRMCNPEKYSGKKARSNRRNVVATPQ